MRATVLHEPELEFANGGRHVDPRHGVADYGPVDAGTRGAPSKTEVGIVGPPDGFEGVRAWLDACREPIAPKSPNKYPKLFRDFPGFNEDAAFRSSLVFDDGLTRVISTRDLNRVASKPGAVASAAAVELYADAVADLADTNRCRVILCARPDDLDEHGDRRRAEDDEKDASNIEVDTRKVDFHDLLKSRTIHHRTPMQLISSTTWNRSATGRLDQSDAAPRRCRMRRHALGTCTPPSTTRPGACRPSRRLRRRDSRLRARAAGRRGLGPGPRSEAHHRDRRRALPAPAPHRRPLATPPQTQRGRRRIRPLWAVDAPGLETCVVYDPISAAAGMKDYLAGHPTGLVAVTSHRRDRVPYMVLGSGAADIVHASTAPVLVVPAQAVET